MYEKSHKQLNEHTYNVTSTALSAFTSLHQFMINHLSLVVNISIKIWVSCIYYTHLTLVNYNGLCRYFIFIKATKILYKITCIFFIQYIFFLITKLLFLRLGLENHNLKLKEPHGAREPTVSDPCLKRPNITVIWPLT